MTDMFFKPTDSRQYLHFHSSHPRHVTRNIPYCLSYRICQIVSEPERRKQQLYSMKQRLINLKYPEQLIDNAIEKSLGKTSQIVQKSTDIIPFKFTYSHMNVHYTCDNIFPILNNMLKKSFKNRKTMFLKSIKQPPSLLKHIKQQKNTFSVTKCGRSRCKTCQIIIQSRKTINIGSMQLPITSNMNCTTTHVIYLIFCSGCNNFYVGQTTQQLCNRMTLHRQHINTPNYANQPVSHHIRQCGSQFLVSPLFQSPIKSSYILLKMEQFFINLLKPVLNCD
jgi:ferredoxin